MVLLASFLDEVLALFASVFWNWQYEHGNYLIRLLEAAGAAVELLSKTASSVIPTGMSTHIWICVLTSLTVIPFSFVLRHRRWAKKYVKLSNSIRISTGCNTNLVEHVARFVSFFHNVDDDFVSAAIPSSNFLSSSIWEQETFTFSCDGFERQEQDSSWWWNQETGQWKRAGKIQLYWTTSDIFHVLQRTS
jgi:hypothetical protein